MSGTSKIAVKTAECPDCCSALADMRPVQTVEIADDERLVSLFICGRCCRVVRWSLEAAVA